MTLQETVEELLDFLDEVEEDFQAADISSLDSQLGKKLVKRLRKVADVVDKKLNMVEIVDDDDSIPQDVPEESVEEDVKPSVKRERVSEQQSITIESDEESLSISSGAAVKQETKLPSPLPPGVPQLRQAASAPASQVQGTSTQAHSLQSQQPPAHQFSMYNRFGNPKPIAADEHTRKRQREAESIVKTLKPQNYSCGISYTSGDQKEKEFSDGIKSDIRQHLPSLKTHMHIFHYMAWATTERLGCDYCRKCPNVYK